MRTNSSLFGTKASVRTELFIPLAGPIHPVAGLIHPRAVWRWASSCIGYWTGYLLGD